MTPVQTLSFQCALITGGGGGLGKAMAQDLIKRGKRVILAGRTESTLQVTCKEIGASGYYILDTGNISSIGPFISKIIEEHPDLDCLINNAGVQKPLQVLGPDYPWDLDTADQEIDINIRGPMYLTIGLIKDHFQYLKDGAVIMNVGSILGFLPFAIDNPCYNGTKAWIHMFTMNLRTQLKMVNSRIKVVEIAPPTVETDLHRDKSDPDDNKKEKNPVALSLKEFMDEVGKGWEGDEDMIAPGMAKGVVDKWYETYGEKYEESGRAMVKKYSKKDEGSS